MVIREMVSCKQWDVGKKIGALGHRPLCEIQGGGFASPHILLLVGEYFLWLSILT